MSTPSMWAILGIAPTTDIAIIRRAYAMVLRQTNPDEDPAGFARLRQAYEVALLQARAAAVSVAPVAPGVPAPGGDPPVGAPLVESEASGVATPAASVVADAALGASAPADESAAPLMAPGASAGRRSVAAVPPTVEDFVSGSPTDLDQLRGAFASLQTALAGADTPSLEVLHSLLEACLQSPALENLSVQIEFESAIVRLLLQYQPRSLPLLETVIERWRWRERGRMVGGGIAALVAHADDLRHLARLATADPRAHSALTRNPDPLRLWMQIVLFRLDRSVREEMAQWRSNGTGSANPQALAWWRRLFQRPHLEPGLIRATGIFVAMGVLFGAVAGIDDGSVVGHALTAGIVGLLAGVCLTGMWWGLIARPRYRLTQTQRAVPRWVRMGWAPVAFAACVVTSLCPDTAAMTLGAVVLSSAVVWWAALMAPAVAPRTRDSFLIRAWVALVGNVAIVIWWGLLATLPEVAPTGPMWITFAGALLTWALGQPVLWHEFQASLSPARRQSARALIGGIALAALAGLFYINIRPGWSNWLLAGLSMIVLLHRVAVANLNATQLKVRYYITVIPAAIVARELSHEDLGAALRMGGMLFMIGVASSMATCFYNGWLANRRGELSEA